MNEQDPLIQRLSDANPVPQHHVDGANRTPFANDLLARLTGGRRHRISVLAREPAQHRLVAVAAVLVVVLVVGTLVLRDGERSPATASELLLRTAAVAGNREPPGGEGTYLYKKIQTDQLTSGREEGQVWSAVLPVVEETWVAVDGSGRTRSVIGRHRFLGPRDVARWQAAGSPEFAFGIEDTKLPPQTFPYEDVNSLPTQGEELLAYLREHVAAEELPSDIAVLMKVGELLARDDAEPKIRAALYRVVAGVPRVELLEPTVDPVGRPGVAVGMTYDDSGSRIRVVMIFDQETSELLATERILLERASWVDADPGTRLSYIAYLESGRTDSIEEAPAPQG